MGAGSTVSLQFCLPRTLLAGNRAVGTRWLTAIKARFPVRYQLEELLFLRQSYPVVVVRLNPKAQDEVLRPTLIFPQCSTWKLYTRYN